MRSLSRHGDRDDTRVLQANQEGRATWKHRSGEHETEHVAQETSRPSRSMYGRAEGDHASGCGGIATMRRVVTARDFQDTGKSHVGRLQRSLDRCRPWNRRNTMNLGVPEFDFIMNLLKEPNRNGRLRRDGLNCPGLPED